MPEQLPDLRGETFKRNQVDWTLWNSFQDSGGRKREPTSRFLNRIKRLLDLDRSYRPGPIEDPEFAEFAFSEFPTEGKGHEAEFKPFDVFGLALAMELLDGGMKPSDAVFFIRAARSFLSAALERLAASYDRSDRQKALAENYPSLPSFESNGIEWADFGVFLVIRRVGLIELIERQDLLQFARQMPIFHEPNICWGRKELAERLSDLRLQQRKAIVAEIGFMSSSVCIWLARSEAKSRGRESA